jgi:hypothetical protein
MKASKTGSIESIVGGGFDGGGVESNEPLRLLFLLRRLGASRFEEGEAESLQLQLWTDASQQQTMNCSLIFLAV